MKKSSIQTVLNLVIDHDRPLSDLQDKVAGRAWSIDGVTDVNFGEAINESNSAPQTTFTGEASPGLLMAMAVRFDPSLADPEFGNNFDQVMGAGSFNARIQRVVSMMRVLHKEATGQGGFTPTQEEHYRALMAAGQKTAALIQAQAEGKVPSPTVL